MSFKEWAEKNGVDYVEPSVATAVQFSDPSVMSLDDWLDTMREAWSKAVSDKFYWVEDDDGKIIAITGCGFRSGANAFAIAEALSQKNAIQWITIEHDTKQAAACNKFVLSQRSNHDST